MIKNNENVQLLIEVFCILVLISLILGIYLNGVGLSCDKCYITFKQTKSLGQVLNPPKIISIKTIDLFNNFSEGNCLVEWDKDNGFMDKSKIIQIKEMP
jgi:hypothetical protein